MSNGLNWSRAKKQRADVTTGQQYKLEKAADQILAAGEPKQRATTPRDWRKGCKQCAHQPSRRMIVLMRPETTGADVVVRPLPEGVMPWDDV